MDAIIYGAGSFGKAAKYFLPEEYNVVAFVDSDSGKWGTRIEGIMVHPPEFISSFDHEFTLIIASQYWKDILKKNDVSGIKKVMRISRPELVYALPETVCVGLDERTICLGEYVSRNECTKLKELTYIPGGSWVLDYLFLLETARRFNCRTYLEIGTNIGESINVVSEQCERLISITLPIEEQRDILKELNLPYYTERLSYSDKIEHHYTRSEDFDFSEIGREVDLFFIDGDHRYNAVYSDTRNVFKNKRDDAIVIWHDFRNLDLRQLP